MLSRRGAFDTTSSTKTAFGDHLHTQVLIANAVSLSLCVCVFAAALGHRSQKLATCNVERCSQRPCKTIGLSYV